MKQRTNPRRILQIIHQTTLEVGLNNETRVLHAYTSDYPSPERIPWVADVRHSDATEEARGIDIVFTTDAGVIHFQIKSSRFGEDQFKKEQQSGRYSKRILTAVITARDTPQQIRNKITPRLTTERNRRLEHTRRYEAAQLGK